MKKIIALVLLIASTTASPKDKDGFSLEHGIISCAKLVEVLKDRHGEEQLGMWVSGYVTAYNRYNENTYSLLGQGNLRGALVWIDDYCKANSIKNTGDAMDALIQGVHAHRYKTRAESRQRGSGAP